MSSEENCSITMDDLREALESEVPLTLIITNVPDEVFKENESKLHFEELFRRYDREASFRYLFSFRRAKVTMQSSEASLLARVQMHKYKLPCGTEIKVYFAQPTIPLVPSEPHLKPPKPERQFLISPPSSPPVDWEPILESTPVINYDLLNALAALEPGESHQLHPPTADQPGIVITPCEEQSASASASGVAAGGGMNDNDAKPKIVQTRCPERKQH